MANTLNNKLIATALVTIAKLDSTKQAHVDVAAQLMLKVMPSLTEKLLTNVEIASGLVTDRYLVEAITDALDEITDEETPDVNIDNDNVGDKEGEEEANDSIIMESADVETILSKAIGLLS